MALYVNNLVASIVLSIITALFVMARSCCISCERSSRWTVEMIKWHQREKWLVFGAGVLFWAYCGGVWTAVASSSYNENINADESSRSRFFWEMRKFNSQFGAYGTTLCITFCRFAIIIFYTRTFYSFRPTYFEQQSLFLSVIGLFTAIWFIAAVFWDLFKCRPYEKAYKDSAKGSCANELIGFGILEVTSSLLNVMLVGFLYFMIASKVMVFVKRLEIQTALAMGGFVCLTSLMRIVEVTSPKDPAVVLNENTFWHLLQLGFAIVCCCIAPVRSILPELVADPRLL
ncbi:hypothetical protein K469DRAFT_705676 [Zopfia rhizophila CBS 207.26]|uniref:Rhodopsin domain-containing protein n=1 Tax=Zopfia rhizophila CBS 207.26 TaxID=1314779 RepID=A0A6A6E5M0_9PEZI|nr:hypothetical protein K469DRAFT_705676 [Zopfia rhizophila CBS 207.26]